MMHSRSQNGQLRFRLQSSTAFTEMFQLRNIRAQHSEWTTRRRMERSTSNSQRDLGPYHYRAQEKSTHIYGPRVPGPNDWTAAQRLDETGRTDCFLVVTLPSSKVRTWERGNRRPDLAGLGV
jgi:hypothetical protein